MNSSAHLTELDLILAVIEPEREIGFMIDVGAHCGDCLRHFIRHNWQTLAFEPDIVNRTVLEKKYGHSAKLQIDPRAIADQPKDQVSFYRSNVSTGISTLTSFHDSHQSADFLVDVTTLSSIFEEYKLEQQPIDFLKIDAEGYDLRVLQGYPWHLNHPGIIMVEFEDLKTEQLGYKFHDLAQYLVEHGYHLMISEWYPIVRYGSQHQWRRYTLYPCELQDPKAWGNIIAFKEEDAFNQAQSLCQQS